MSQLYVTLMCLERKTYGKEKDTKLYPFLTWKSNGHNFKHQISRFQYLMMYQMIPCLKK